MRSAPEEGEILYGPHSIEELFQIAPSRIQKLYLLQGAERRLSALRERAEREGVPVLFRSRKELDLLAPGARHQGALARCAPFSYETLEDLLERPAAPQNAPFLAVLDSIVDPQNLGAILRSAVWFGVQGVVIPKDRASPVTPAAVKASAGAALRARVAREVNLARVLDQLSEAGILPVAAVLEKEALPPWEVDLTRPCAILIGAEGRGVRPLLRRKCGALVRIIGEGFESLNAAQAATILFYEVARQRAAKGAKDGRSGSALGAS